MHDNEVRDKVRKLVEQLISSTENGRIVWTDTTDEDAFRANMQGGMVRVQKRLCHNEEGDEESEFSLTLLDLNARELEEYCPAPYVEQRELADLWNRARRSARRTVNVLDTLLKETAS